MKKTRKQENKDFITEYKKVFEIIGINPDKVQHEWNKKGDTIRVFTLFEDHPKPILTPNTHSIVNNTDA